MTIFFPRPNRTTRPGRVLPFRALIILLFAFSSPVFAAETVRLSNSSAPLGLTTSGPHSSAIPLLESTGGKIENASTASTIVDLRASRIHLISGATEISSAPARTVRLTADTLTGTGELRITGGTTLLDLANARGFLGSLRLASGILNFDRDISSSGPLLIKGGHVILDQSVTVPTFIVSGINYPAGTYRYPELHTAHPAIFTSGTTAGSITVKPPVTWYLKPANQQNPHHWNTPADWNSAPDGTGAELTEFRAADTFDTNGRQTLRTPFVGTPDPDNTFAGGQLRITNSRTLLGLKATHSAATLHLPYLYATNGKIVQNANTPISLRIDSFENQAARNSSFTFNAAKAPHSGLTLSIGTLFGEGTLRLSGTGVRFILSIDDASLYTGDLLHAFGHLNFDNDIHSSGRLQIDAGTTITLDQSVTFTGLKIAGTDYPEGTYSFATLQTAHSQIFTTGLPAASITVRPATLLLPPKN